MTDLSQSADAVGHYKYPPLFQAQIYVEDIEKFLAKYFSLEDGFHPQIGDSQQFFFSRSDINSSRPSLENYGSPELLFFDDQNTPFGNDFEALREAIERGQERPVDRAAISYLGGLLISELLDHSQPPLISPNILASQLDIPSEIFRFIDWDVDYVVVSSLKIPTLMGHITPKRLKQLFAAVGISYAAIANYPGFKAGCAEIAADLNGLAQQAAKSVALAMNGDISQPEVSVKTTAASEQTGDDDDNPLHEYFIEAINNPRRWQSYE